VHCSPRLLHGHNHGALEGMGASGIHSHLARSSAREHMRPAVCLEANSICQPSLPACRRRGALIVCAGLRQATSGKTHQPVPVVSTQIYTKLLFQAVL
jgi:hypothetical protein